MISVSCTDSEVPTLLTNYPPLNVEQRSASEFADYDQLALLKRSTSRLRCLVNGPSDIFSPYSGTTMVTSHLDLRRRALAKLIRDAIVIVLVPTVSLSGKTVTGGCLNVSGF